MKAKLIFTILTMGLLTQYSFASSNLDPYKKIRDTFIEVYSPIVLMEGKAKLVIELDEDYPTNFGGMSFEDGKLLIAMGSEYHTQAGVTPDSYAAIICHEIGHLIGGKPKKENLWSSTEAQSDYYSGAVCLKKILPHLPLLEEINVPKIVKDDCAKAYKTSAETKLCERIANAGYVLMMDIHRIFKKFGDRTYHTEPSLERKELTDISHNKLYPNVQCRLDTIVAGSLCTERKENGHDGLCDSKEGYTVGLRPSCWNIEGF